MSDTLNPGEVRVGHVISAASSGPLQGAVVTFNETDGGRLVVAYRRESPDAPSHQFAEANLWFEHTGTGVPETLLFDGVDGPITLNGAQFARSQGGSLAQGELRAHLWIFERPRTFRDAYLVKDFASKLDGLDEFAGFSSLDFEVQRTESTRRVTVVVEANDVVEWRHNGFDLRVRSSVAWTGEDGRSFEATDTRPLLESSSSDGAAVDAHLGAQWPIRALLILVHGTPLAWRSHSLRDDAFPFWMLDGHAESAGFVRVLVSGTLAQHYFAEPDPAQLQTPLISLADIGPEGMTKWSELYADDNFRRAVEPAVEVINGATRFLEPQLMMLAISLDRFGYYRFSDHRRRPMHVHIRRCIESARLDWPTIGTPTGIAMGIANINNDLKHPDRQNYPESELGPVTRLARVIARAQIFDLLDAPDVRRASFLNYGEAANVIDEFRTRGISFDDDGMVQREVARG